MKQRIETLEHVIAAKTKIINGLAIRNGGRGLIGVLLEFVRGVRPRSTKSVVKQVAVFVFKLYKLIKHSGSKGAIIYLKASQVLLQQSVGGYRVLDLADLKVRPKRNRRGLPLIIPAGARILITRDRNIPTIKLWMTLLGFFRIMEFIGKLSFDTITTPGSMSPSFIPGWERWLERDFRPKLLRMISLPMIGQPYVFPIAKSGPTTSTGDPLMPPLVSTSVWSLITASRIWIRMSHLWPSLVVLSTGLNAPALPNRIELVSMVRHSVLDRVMTAFMPHPSNDPRYKGDPTSQLGYLGKLGFKIEPAGKIRVFAMVDAWTQWLLAPLHKWIFEILSQISFVDGTFDQLSPVSDLQSRFIRDKRVKGRTFSSIDLSAATDRLPIALQKSVLKVLLKRRVPDSGAFAEAWGDLLVKRSYKVSLSQQLKRGAIIPKTTPKDVMYAVGQPMGALSSWAMLALTHHAIVQYAASRVNYNSWFRDYAILGDDVVIMDGKVAEEYKRILREIGVSAGLAKSIVSKSKFVVEFAKKFFVDSTQANMLPIKECIAARTSTSLVLEFTRKYSLSLNSVLAFLSYGYKSRSNAVNKNLFELGMRMRVILVWLSHPSSPLGVRSYLKWVTQFKYGKPFPASEISERAKREMIFVLRRLCHEKVVRILSALQRYRQSVAGTVSRLDSEHLLKVPEPSYTEDWGGDFELSPLSWSYLLSDDFSEKSIVNLDTNMDTDYDSPVTFYNEFTPASSKSASLLPPALKEVALQGGGDLQYFHGDERIVLFVPLSQHIIWERADRYLNWLFEEDPVTPLIPEEFWGEERKAMRPFRDFLQVYSIWQQLSRPIWAHFYKDKYKQPDLGSKKRERDIKAKPGTALILIGSDSLFFVDRPWSIGREWKPAPSYWAALGQKWYKLLMTDSLYREWFLPCLEVFNTRRGGMFNSLIPRVKGLLLDCVKGVILYLGSLGISLGFLLVCIHMLPVHIQWDERGSREFYSEFLSKEPEFPLWELLIGIVVVAVFLVLFGFYIQKVHNESILKARWEETKKVVEDLDSSRLDMVASIQDLESKLTEEVAGKAYLLDQLEDLRNELWSVQDKLANVLLDYDISLNNELSLITRIQLLEEELLRAKLRLAEQMLSNVGDSLVGLTTEFSDIISNIS